MYIHTHVHYTYLHIHTYIYICIYLHTYIHTYIHTCIHTYIPTYIHTYILYCILWYIAYSHEVAETAGLLSHAFGTDEEENRHVIIFKKVATKDIIIIKYNIILQEYPPSEEELQVLRKGEVYI